MRVDKMMEIKRFSTSEELINTIIASGAFTAIKIIGVTGSIGRGEKELSDTQLNDVDFFVVADEADVTVKKELDLTLQEMTGTIFTDVLYISTDRFKKYIHCKTIPQFIFDIFRGSLILYIDQDFYPDILKSQDNEYSIIYDSAVAVLYTRIWCLTGPYQVHNGNICPLDDEEFTFRQMKKAITAIIDAILICEGIYNSPKWSDKLQQITGSGYYEKHKDELDTILELHNNICSENFTFAHQNLIRQYINAINYIRSTQERYLEYCIKYNIIYPLLSREQRRINKATKKQYQTLQLIQELYNPKTHSKDSERQKKVIEKLSILYRENYLEVMNE